MSISLVYLTCEGDECRCDQCGKVLRRPQNHVATVVPHGCLVDANPAPSLLTKAANFATSAARHVAAGMPQSSEEEVARRFAICQACEHYDGKACRKCGCPIVREKQFVSKLSWASESCPVGKWGPAS